MTAVDDVDKASWKEEPRSGGTFIAWGVSPRIPAEFQIRSSEGAADIGRIRVSLSPLRGFCFFGQAVTLGLTPQATSLSPLRG